ncbi:putative U4/U6 small nuclear ribonuclear protein [Leptomonas seymouri]|uniref:Putative U4/U6 small nuclear ribonuclear protein n=1 Tax=Leptomonas seymouri TaxID=5684 RepID=A0A0N0P3A5_LEPSE|nr:putative U4/U6 small nuclear ribonuclear protein [Leptomonas seymouri]|eukprot:KPI83899.1 putative U4/U6 small nuclear ribonuclear protein [Leptomonas seymouri]
MQMASPSTYVRVAPSPRLKSTQTDAPAELVLLRVQHLLPHTTERAKVRVGKLKKLFIMPTEVMLRDHAAAQQETLQRLRLVKSVRNIKVQNGGAGDGVSASPGGSVAGALCLSFSACAALPPWISASGTTAATAASPPSTDDVSLPLSCVLTGSVDGLLTLWDAEQCTPLCSQSTYPQGRGWGKVRSIAVYPSAAPTASSTAVQQCVAFTASMFQREVRVWRVTQAGQSADWDGSDANEEERQAGASTVAPSVSLEPLTTAAINGDGDTSNRIGGLQQVAVDPTGALLAATHDGGLVHLWDVRSVLEGGGSQQRAAETSASPLQRLYAQDGYETAGATLGVAFHPDGSLLTTTDAGGRVVAWDTRSGELAFHTGGRVGGHLRAALCVAWSPCGVRLATGGADGVVHLYDARKLSKAGLGPHNDGAHGAAPFQLLGHDDAITSISFYANPFFSPSEGPSVLPLGVVTTSLDHTMRVWDADTGVCVRTLDAGMPLYSHCRPALQPMSDRFAVSTALMAVGHGKNWLQYDVGLRGEMLDVEGPSELSPTHGVERVKVKENDVVASAHGGAGGMKLSVLPPAEASQAAKTSTNENEESSSEEDEMMTLRTKKDGPAEASRAATGTHRAVMQENASEEEEDESSEDEMEALKLK